MHQSIFQSKWKKIRKIDLQEGLFNLQLWSTYADCFKGTVKSSFLLLTNRGGVLKDVLSLKDTI